MPGRLSTWSVRSRRPEDTPVTCTESVTTRDGGDAIIQTALEHYGRLDILIHNAGNIRRS